MWTTKDKRKIPIEEMSDQHLLNTVKMLKRAKRDLLEVLNSMPTFNGEMAQMAVEHEMNNISYQLSVTNVWLDILRKEMKRRLHVNEITG